MTAVLSPCCRLLGFVTSTLDGHQAKPALSRCHFTILDPWLKMRKGRALNKWFTNGQHTLEETWLGFHLVPAHGLNMVPCYACFMVHGEIWNQEYFNRITLQSPWFCFWPHLIHGIQAKILTCLIAANVMDNLPLFNSSVLPPIPAYGRWYRASGNLDVLHFCFRVTISIWICSYCTLSF